MSTMASSTTSTQIRIKSEPIDQEYFDSANGTSYQRYGTPMTSSPTGVDSTTVSDEAAIEPSEMSPPPIKKQFVQVREKLLKYEQLTKYSGDIYLGLKNTNLKRKNSFDNCSRHAERSDSANGEKRPHTAAMGGIHSGESTPTALSSPSTPKGHPLAFEHFEGPHSSNVLRAMSDMRETRSFVDLILIVDGKEIPCHRIVICAASSYFNETLTPSINEIQHQYVTETSNEIMTQLVDFAYTSRVTITAYLKLYQDTNIEELLAAASHFKFSAVREACMSFLKRKITPGNCIAIESFATSQCCSQLAEYARSFALEKFLDMTETKEFLELRVEQLISYISSVRLNVPREEMVYSAVMKWIRHQLNHRKRYLPLLFEHVRLPSVKPQFLLDVIQTDPLVRSNKDCEQFLDEARRFHLLADQRPLMQSSRTQPRIAYKLQKTEIVVVVGGLNKDKSLVPDCFYYSFPEIYGQPLGQLQISQTAYSVATVNNNIFVTGGAHSSACNEVWMYVPSLDVWQQVAPLLEGRYLHTSVGLGNYLYVAGGHNGTKRLSSVERYNPDSNTWVKVQPMLEALSSPSAVTCDGCLYVIGGAKGSSPNDIVSKVQCYNPTLNAWSNLEPLPQPERGAVAANLNGIVYVFGQHRRVYAYNSHTNRWNKMNSTNGGHLHGAATVHKGRLYLAGGLHGNNYINGTVEVYDQLNDSWCVISTLNTPVYAQGFVSICKDIK